MGGSNHGQRRFTKKETLAIKRRYKRGQDARCEYMKISITALAEKFEISPPTVRNIARGTIVDYSRSKLSIAESFMLLDLIDESKTLHKKWQRNSIVQIAKDYGTSTSVIQKMVHGVSYKNWS